MKFKQKYDKFKRYGCKNCGAPVKSELCYQCSQLPEFKNLEKGQQKKITQW